MKYKNEVLLDACQPKYSWDKRNTRPSPGYPPVCTQIASNLYKRHNLDEYGISKDKTRTIVASAIVDAFAHIAHNDGIYGVEEIVDAIGIYLHSDIQRNLIQWSSSSVR